MCIIENIYSFSLTTNEQGPKSTHPPTTPSAEAYQTFLQAFTGVTLASLTSMILYNQTSGEKNLEPGRTTKIGVMGSDNLQISRGLR